MRKWVCLERLWTEGESPRTVEAASRGGYLAPELAGVGAHERQNPCWPGPSDRPSGREERKARFQSLFKATRLQGQGLRGKGVQGRDPAQSSCPPKAGADSQRPPRGWGAGWVRPNPRGCAARATLWNCCPASRRRGCGKPPGCWSGPP